MNSANSNRPLVLVAHGSRLDQSKYSVEHLAYLLRTIRPNLLVYTSYLELREPQYSQLASQVATDAVVVPLLLTHGLHLSHDVYEQAFKNKLTAAKPLGPDPSLVQLLDLRLRQAKAPEHANIILAAAGSKDASSNGDVKKVAEQLSRLRNVPVLVGFMGSATPKFSDVLAACEKKTTAVSSYLLSPGRFQSAISSCGATWIAGPLGNSSIITNLVLDRYDTAARQNNPLQADHRSKDNCALIDRRAIFHH